MTKISKDTYFAGYLRRWHTVACAGISNQSLAEHSWGVAMIIIQNHPNPSVNLLKAALMHDLHEVRFGDLPGPIKREHTELSVIEQKAKDKFWQEAKIEYPELTEEEQWWLDLADKMEAVVYLEMQRDTNVFDRVLFNSLQATSEVLKRGTKFGVEA